MECMDLAYVRIPDGVVRKLSFSGQIKKSRAILTLIIILTY